MKLTKIQKKNIAKIAKKYRLKLVLFFGSFVKGNVRNDSDLDVAILREKNISFEKYLNLIVELSKIFRKNIDLTNLNEANPLLLFQVSKNSILIYGNQKDFVKLKLYAFHRYNDYLPYFKMERELNKKLIKQYAGR